MIKLTDIEGFQFLLPIQMIDQIEQGNSVDSIGSTVHCKDGSSIEVTESLDAIREQAAYAGPQMGDSWAGITMWAEGMRIDLRMTKEQLDQAVNKHFVLQELAVRATRQLVSGLYGSQE